MSNSATSATYEAVNRQLMALPGYREAVTSAGQYDRAQVARAFASAHGIAVPAGAVNDKGEFYDPNATHWYSNPAVIGPLAIGAATGAAALLGAPAAAAGAASSGLTADGLLPATHIPQFASAVLPSVVGTGVPAASAAGAAGATSAATATSAGILDRLKAAVKDPLQLAKIGASTVPLFQSAFGGNDNGALGEHSPLMDEIQQSLALQRKRTEQAQPVYDALVNMAYARTPTRYRGDAPAGYPSGADAAPAGAYAYTPPRFG